MTGAITSTKRNLILKKKKKLKDHFCCSAMAIIQIFEKHSWYFQVKSGSSREHILITNSFQPLVCQLSFTSLILPVITLLSLTQDYTSGINKIWSFWWLEWGGGCPYLLFDEKSHTPGEKNMYKYEMYSGV